MPNIEDSPPIARGTPLPEHDRQRLAALVAAEGERAALARVGCSKSSLRSALAAMPIYRVTAAAIRAALDAADRDRR